MFNGASTALLLGGPLLSFFVFQVGHTVSQWGQHYFSEIRTKTKELLRFCLTYLFAELFGNQILMDQPD